MRRDVFRVLDRLGIEYIVRGKRLVAKCPFHEDANPSWYIHWDGEFRGQHYCQSCKGGGGLVKLVAHVLKVENKDAHAWLEGAELEEVPEPIPVEVKIDARSAKPMAFGLPAPLEGIFEPLSDWVEPARRYIEQRHITPEQVERWRIGYAVDGPLAGRIIIPVYDAKGRLANYMARTFVGAEKRYLYPKQQPGFDPDALFGEFHWGAFNRVVVTEGALNALAVERAVGGNVAALGGSGIRDMHAIKIAIFPEVVLLTDPDDAGDEAAAKLRARLARHANVTRVRLPEGQDADTLSREELRVCLTSVPRHS